MMKPATSLSSAVRLLPKRQRVYRRLGSGEQLLRRSSVTGRADLLCSSSHILQSPFHNSSPFAVCFSSFSTKSRARNEEQEEVQQQDNKQEEEELSTPSSSASSFSHTFSKGKLVRKNTAVDREEQPMEKIERIKNKEKGLPVTFADISTASYRIRNGIVPTTCVRSTQLGSLTGVDLYLKKDYRQVTGSFKERGARNALELLSKEQKKTGVIAASAGNHALALAYHGQQLGIPVTCVMPTIAPLTKINRCREFGARIILHGEHILKAREHAAILEQEEGLTYINGFDHPHIIAGAGTLGVEILTQVPDADAIIVPVGGGGLIAGISLAAKTLKPDIEIIAAEPELCASFNAAMDAGKPVDTPTFPTLADGLAVPKVGDNAFAVAKNFVDRICVVPEKSIAVSVLRFVEYEKTVVEGGGACGLAALLDGQLPHLKGKKVVLPVCGGNIDITVLGRVIERGLAADGRLIRFVATVSDRPGGISSITKILADNNASIKDIQHERAWLQSSISEVQVKCVIEITSESHGQEVRKALEARFPLIWGCEVGKEFTTDYQEKLKSRRFDRI